MNKKQKYFSFTIHKSIIFPQKVNTQYHLYNHSIFFIRHQSFTKFIAYKYFVRHIFPSTYPLSTLYHTIVPKAFLLHVYQTIGSSVSRDRNTSFLNNIPVTKSTKSRLYMKSYCVFQECVNSKDIQ